MENMNPILERTLVNILASLNASVLVNVYGKNDCLGIALRHHQGNQSRTCSYVKDMVSSFCPSSQQYTVCTHFHGTFVLVNGELLKFEHGRLFNDFFPFEYGTVLACRVGTLEL